MAEDDTTRLAVLLRDHAALRKDVDDIEMAIATGHRDVSKKLDAVLEKQSAASTTLGILKTKIDAVAVNVGERVSHAEFEPYKWGLRVVLGAVLVGIVGAVIALLNLKG